MKSRPGSDGSTGSRTAAGCSSPTTSPDGAAASGTLAQVDRAEGDRSRRRPPAPSGSIDIADFPLTRRCDGGTATATMPADGAEVDLELGHQGHLRHDRDGGDTAPATTGASPRVPSPTTSSGRAPAAWPDPFTPHGVRHSLRPPRRRRVRRHRLDGAARLPHRVRVRSSTSSRSPTPAATASGRVPDSPTRRARRPAPRPLSARGDDGRSPGRRGQRAASPSSPERQLGGTGTTVDVTTDADGLATTTWSIDSATVLQQATADLLGDDAPRRSAGAASPRRLLTAPTASYDPAASPSLAGTVTVQEAIDRLAATTGDGCPTLTLSPGAGWVEALASIPAGADASVCFRPGTYESAEPARLRSLGHVHLSGAGVASALVVTGSEVALSFETCASVTIDDLRVEVTTYPVDSVRNDLGVVTAVDCGPVRLTGVELVCPATPGPRAACLTVRGDNVPAELDLDGCTMVVGHTQTGALLVDVTRAHVTGSTFTTPARPSTLDLGGLLGNVKVRDRVAKLLAGRLVLDRADQADRGGFNTAVRVKDWVVRMNSTVPEQEWKALVAAQPPADADVRSAEAMQAYMARRHRPCRRRSHGPPHVRPPGPRVAEPPRRGVRAGVRDRGGSAHRARAARVRRRRGEAGRDDDGRWPGRCHSPRTRARCASTRSSIRAPGKRRCSPRPRATRRPSPSPDT